MDGHKYHSSQKSYYNELRRVSDELCRRYGLSVIRSGTNAPDHSRHYAEWQAEQNGRPTWCSAIKEDVDAAIAASASFELISVLCDERAGLRGKPSPEAEARLAVIREQLKTLRREVRICDEIEEDSILLEEKRQALRSILTERPQKRTRTQREKT